MSPLDDYGFLLFIYHTNDGRCHHVHGTTIEYEAKLILNYWTNEQIEVEYKRYKSKK